MSNSQEKLREKVERQIDKHHEDDQKSNYRDITRVQADEPWPEPPSPSDDNRDERVNDV
jgi:hypothetical protein